MYIYNFFINFMQCLYILRFMIYKNEKINYDTIHDSHFNNYGYTVQPKKKKKKLWLYCSPLSKF